MKNLVCSLNIVVTVDENGFYAAGLADWCTLNTYGHDTPGIAVRVLMTQLLRRLPEVITEEIAKQEALSS